MKFRQLFIDKEIGEGTEYNWIERHFAIRV
jgi:hypothetical protein